MRPQVDQRAPLELYFNQAVDHMRLNFSMVRLMAEEGFDVGKGPQSSVKRRFPKTGRFRKSLSATDWVAFESLKKLYKPCRLAEPDPATTPSTMRQGWLSLEDAIERPGWAPTQGLQSSPGLC